MWNCVEDRIQFGHFGRVIRKIIFDDVYADRTAVLSDKPIARSTLPFLKSGENVAFYDNCDIREGRFLCCSQSKSRLDPKTIVSELLSTDDEVRNFCKENNLAKKNDHIYSMVIEAFLFLMRKMSTPQYDNVRPSNTSNQAGRTPVNRKRPINLEPEIHSPVKIAKTQIPDTTADGNQTVEFCISEGDAQNVDKGQEVSEVKTEVTDEVQIINCESGELPTPVDTSTDQIIPYDQFLLPSDGPMVPSASVGHFQDVTQICRICLTTKRDLYLMNDSDKAFFNLEEQSPIHQCIDCKEQMLKCISDGRDSYSVATEYFNPPVPIRTITVCDCTMPCHLCNKWDLRNSFPTPKAYFQYVINNPELDEQRSVLESVTFQNRSADDCKVFPPMFDEAFKKLYIDGAWTSYLKCMKCNQLLKINTKTSKLALTQHMSQHDGTAPKRQRKSVGGGASTSHHMGHPFPPNLAQILPSMDNSQNSEGYIKPF